MFSTISAEERVKALFAKRQKKDRGVCARRDDTSFSTNVVSSLNYVCSGYCYEITWNFDDVHFPILHNGLPTVLLKLQGEEKEKEIW